MLLIPIKVLFVCPISSKAIALNGRYQWVIFYPRISFTLNCWILNVGKNVFLFLSMALFTAIVSTRLKVSIVTVCAIVLII